MKKNPTNKHSVAFCVNEKAAQQKSLDLEVFFCTELVVVSVSLSFRIRKSCKNQTSCEDQKEVLLVKTGLEASKKRPLRKILSTLGTGYSLEADPGRIHGKPGARGVEIGLQGRWNVRGRLAGGSSSTG